MRANHLFVFFASGQQLRRFNDGVQAIEIKHAVLPRRSGLVLVQTGVIALQGVDHGACCATGKNHNFETNFTQFTGALDGRLPPSTILATKGMRCAN